MFFVNNISMKKIFITGSRSGIIKNVYDKLSCDEYFIYASVHTLKEKERLQEIYKERKNIQILKLDLTNKNDILSVKNLDIDILILNAAYGFSSPIFNMDMSKLREIYEVNIFGNVLLLQNILNNMITKNNGKIILISSIIGLAPIEFLSGYASSKSAILTIGLCLKKELKLMNKNIKVKIVEPGVFKTGFNEMMLTSNDLDGYSNREKRKIKLKEFFIFDFLAKKNLEGISKTIIKAINSNSNRLVYSYPKFEKIYAKIYQVFKY